MQSYYFYAIYLKILIFVSYVAINERNGTVHAV